MSGQQTTARILTLVAVAMLGLGFASKPLYDTFCKVTGYGGTTKQAVENESEILDRKVNIYFDSNVQLGLPWDFTPEQAKMTVNVGQSGLAYYKVKNTSNRAIVGTATYNVTPTKAAPYFIKTECFCFTEQRIEPGAAFRSEDRSDRFIACRIPAKAVNCLGREGDQPTGQQRLRCGRDLSPTIRHAFSQRSDNRKWQSARVAPIPAAKPRNSNPHVSTTTAPIADPMEAPR